MAKPRKLSIRFRILVTTLALIVVSFLLIQAVFNYLIREYTLTSVKDQLNDVLRFEAGTAYLRPSPGPAGSGRVMVISPQYDLVLPDLGLGTAYWQINEETLALATKLAADKVNLRSNRIMNTEAAGRDYYFVSLLEPSSNNFYIYYFDMTAISAFAGRINITLLWVMGFAGLLAVGAAIFLSGIIVSPLRELTRFARRLGQGDFSPSGMDYQDAELAELAGSMNRAARQLAQYDQEQRTFFQNVSHELRTPLQAIRSSAEGIEHGILEPEKSSRVIIDETDRLSEMVEGLLYLSRMDNNPGQPRLERVDLREVLSNSAQQLRSLADSRGIDFAFEFAQDPVETACDEQGLARAFSNLIANAIRYANSRITLSCRGEGGKAVVVVADDGEGISAQDLPHIFARFYKGRGGKHGIGLSIAQAVIRQHGGEITAANNQGAVFTVTLPLDVARGGH